MDGISLLKEGESFGPNIYMNMYYEKYQMGMPIDAIAKDIIEKCTEAYEEVGGKIQSFAPLNFDEIKDILFLKVVNYEKNKEQLENCPYKKICDLAITFRLLAEKDNKGLASSLVMNKEFEAWGMDIESLYEIALENTKREFPADIKSLIDVVFEESCKMYPEFMLEQIKDDIEKIKESEQVQMDIFSNSCRLNGATCILYTDVLKAYAEEKGSDIYILPSSIHELMLSPVHKNNDVTDLKELVNKANVTTVGLIDYLSDNVYLYKRDTEEIIIVGQ